MRTVNELINLDINYYKKNNNDLSKLSDQECVKHYFMYGYWEGRNSSNICTRENFIPLFEKKLNLLEIGPFTSPSFTGEGVKYFDVLSQQELIKRANKLNLQADSVPYIDYTHKTGSLKIIKEKFDVVYSSHCIEHQPNLIGHLNEVSEILNKEGYYALIIPNASYCFDANLPLSKISEVLNANAENRTVHTIGSVVEHEALTTHNDQLKHWEFEAKLRRAGLTGRNYQPLDIDRLRNAIDVYDRKIGSYVDVHAWQFDPLVFSDICHCLIDLKIISFDKVYCNGPVYGRNEFTAILKKSLK